MVAIIDEGVLIDTAIQEVNIYESADEYEPVAEKRLHGTNIAAIIRQVCPSANILSVRMVPLQSINVPLLCKALKYCAAQPDIQIINISLGILGTDNPSAELEESCRICVEKGKILVAAAHFNCEKKCYPAAYPFVYGVGAGLHKDINNYTYLGEGYINILAKGIHQRLLHDNGNYIMRGGTSYAAAAFSGILCKRLTADNLMKDSTDALSLHYGSDKSTQYITGNKIGQDWKILSYALDQYREQPLFNMNYLLDGNMPAVEYPGIPNLKPILSGKMFKQINTLMIGNFFDNQYLLNVYFGYMLINHFITYNGNFIVFDEYIANVIGKMVILRGDPFKGEIVLLKTPL